MIIFKGHLNSKNKKIQLTHQTRNIPLWLALPSRQQDEGLPVYWVAASLALVGLDGSKVVLDSCWHHGTLLLILLWRQGKCKHNRVPSGRTGLGKYGWLVLTEQIKLLVKVALSYQVYYRKKKCIGALGVWDILQKYSPVHILPFLCPVLKCIIYSKPFISVGVRDSGPPRN